MTEKTETGERASQAIAGGDPVAGLDPFEMFNALRDLLGPEAAYAGLQMLPELTRVAFGVSDVAPKPKDKRFEDVAWRDNPFFRRLEQSYLVWVDAMERAVDSIDGDGDGYRRFRARSVARIVSDALAPTNFLPTNPAALKRAFDTGGLSVLRGARNWLSDLATNRGMPSQVDTRPYTVGHNLAATPGAVVHREEMFELLQYTPSTGQVRARPLVVIPPQINKYYFLDLAPGRSLVEYLVGQGLQVFMLVWRNPRPEHGRWGMDDYVAAQIRAIEAAGEITGSDDVNVLGACAGGLTTALMLGHLAALGERSVRSASFAIAMVDSSQTNVLKLLAQKRTLGQIEGDAAQGKVYDRLAVAHNFAWMRPNDLVFNYVINNWLMGEDPPAFDVLAWNNDSTNLSARFDADLLDVYAYNKAAVPGGMTVLGTSLDLSKVDCDAYVIGGTTDHITPWKPCYMTSQILGGSTDVIMTSTGHIQTIVNPLDKPRAKFYAGPATRGQGPDEWIDSATKCTGSWWPRYAEWLRDRSGDEQPAPTKLGSAVHPAIDPAPGRYVREK